MNFFCRIFGHTWVHRTEDANPCWNTTKKGAVLVPSTKADTKYFDVCQRCGERVERPLDRTFPDSMDDVDDSDRLVAKD